jgi:hypothetical protein
MLLLLDALGERRQADRGDQLGHLGARAFRHRDMA